VATAADNGVSVDPVSGRIVFGNDVAGIGATLLSSRFIPMATFLLRFLYPTAGQSFTIQNDANVDMLSLIITNSVTKNRGVFVQFNDPANPTTTTTGIRLVNSQTNGTIAAILRNDANRGIQMEVLGTAVAGGDIIRFVMLGGEYRLQIDTVGGFYRWYTSGITQRMALLSNGNLRIAANNTDTTAKLQADGTITADRLVFPRNLTPYNIDVNLNRGNFITNEGASAIIVFNLPTAVTNTTTGGYHYSFYVQDVDGLQIVAAAGDTIRVGGLVTAAAGNISSTVIGSCITLQCINATEWVCESIIGSWVV